MTRQRWQIAGIILIALLLTPFLQGFVRDMIIIPFLYIFWIGWYLASGLPRRELWFFICGVMAVMMAFSLLRRPSLTNRSVTPNSAPNGRIATWLYHIEQTPENRYHQIRLAQGLQTLAIDMLAHQQQQSIKTTRLQLRKGHIDLPPHVAAYLTIRLNSLRQPRWWEIRQTSPLDTPPQEVVTYLEELLNPRSES